MSRQKNLKRNLLICLLAGSAVMYTLPLHAATSVVANNALPQGGIFAGGDAAGSIKQNGNLELNVNQNFQNAVIKWDSFDVGGSATVNFDYTGKSDFNTLNYVNSAQLRRFTVLLTHNTKVIMVIFLLLTRPVCKLDQVRKLM